MHWSTAIMAHAAMTMASCMENQSENYLGRALTVYAIVTLRAAYLSIYLFVFFLERSHAANSTSLGKITESLSFLAITYNVRY
jgi:hypothetical protein